jgi:lysophospholipase L1-like esterase
MQAARKDCVFYFLPAKPSISRWHKWEKFTASNALLKAYCEATENLHYVDTATPMLGPDGSPRPDIFVADKLHMNAEGYKIWTRVVRTELIGE